jgi:hypothetical protein
MNILALLLASNQILLLLQAATDFWNAQAAWLPTWNLNVNDGQDASLQVDYVRIWAL